MAFTIPSLAETRDFLLALGRALFPDRNYANLRSYHSKRATFLAAAVTQVHAHVAAVQRDVMPNTAPDDGPIDDWGSIVGVERKTATPARRAAAGRVVGTPATAVPFDQELVHQASGLRYRIATATTVTASEYVDADIEAIDVGAQTKLLTGQVLEFVSTPVGLQTQVVLVLDVDEDGFDAEQFGSYRNRVLARFGEPTAGGNQSDYVAWGLAIEGVSAAYAYPNRAGIGTVDVVGLHTGSGAARELTAGELIEYVAALQALAPAPISATPGSLRGLDIVVDTQNVEMIITPNGDAANAFDWTGGPLTVLTWTAGTRTLQFNAARPSTMKAGHRITLKGVATVQDGKEYKIEALSSTDSVILETAPTVAPAATDLVYSGGPLVTPIRDAVVAHMNGETVYAGRGRVPLAASSPLLTTTVNIEVIADGIGPANPAGLYGSWSGGLIRAVLMQIALGKAGVRNVSVTTPAADYEATDYAFPNDAQIGLIVPGAVLVRGAT